MSWWCHGWRHRCVRNQASNRHTCLGKAVSSQPFPMSIICLLYANHLCIIGLLRAHSMSIMRQLYVYHVSVICPSHLCWNVHHMPSCLSTIYRSDVSHTYVHHMNTAWPLYVHLMRILCLPYASDMSIICLLYVYHIPTQRPWNVYRMSFLCQHMSITWPLYGLHMSSIGE